MARFLVYLMILTLLFPINPGYARESAGESETPYLKFLREKHDLDNKDRNLRESEELAGKLIVTDDGSQDMRTREALNRILNAQAEEDNRVRPFDNINITPAQQAQYNTNSALWARDIAGSAGMPAAGENGRVKFEYSENATRRVTRNADGTMNIEVIDGGSRRTSGLALEDIYTDDINNSEHSGFDNIKSSYGDEDELFSHGGEHIQGLGNTSKKTSDAVGYRTVMATAEMTASTNLNENFLQSSFNHLTDTQNDPSDFFTSCQSTTETRTIGATGGLDTIYECTEFDDGNYDFCEIRREVKVEERNFNTSTVRCEPEEDKFCGITHGDGKNCWLCSADSGWTSPIVQDEGEVLYFDECETPEQDIGYGCKENEVWVEVFFTEVTFGGFSAASFGGFSTTSFSTFSEEGDEEDDSESKYRVTDTTVQYPAGCFDKVDEPGGEMGPDNICVFDGYDVMDEDTRNYPPSVLDKLSPLFPGDQGNVTWQANLDGYRCYPYAEEGLCITPYGGEGDPEAGIEDEQVCFQWDELKDAVEPCEDIEGQSSCEATSRSCNEGSRDNNGVCRFYSVEYTCTENVGGSAQVNVTSNVCNSMIPCAGGDCDNTNSESNDDFIQAAVQASLLDDINSDFSCADGDTSNCEVFKANYGSCARPVSGSPGKALKLAGPNCCVDATAPSLFEYIRAANAVRQFESVQQLTSYVTTPVHGAWDKVTDAGTNAWNSLTSVFSSGTESVAGNATVSAGGESAVGTGVMEKITTATMKWMAENLPEQMTHALFVTTSTEGVVELVNPPQWSETMQSVGNFAQGFMTAYSYYTIGKLLLDLLFQCKEEESEVAGAISQRSCVAIKSGSCLVGLIQCQRRRYHYCCFNSMLARIVTEQAAVQLGRPLGADEACRGISIEEMGMIDWSQIDLESEWIPTMFASGLIPSETTEDSLTGSGRSINPQHRDIAKLRTLERLGGVDENTLKELRDELKQPVDCSKIPRLPICYYNHGGSN